MDGPVKVSGAAQYTSDSRFPGQLYAVPVEATIANGRVVKLDTAAAEKMPGVRAIFHRENIGKIFRSVLEPAFEGITRRAAPAVRGRRRSLLRPVRRARRGGHIRDRQSRRRCGSRDVREGKAERRDHTSSRKTSRTWSPPPSARASARRASAATPRPLSQSAPVKLDQTYVTPAETHNPIELHATNAIWDGSSLTLYESSQGVVNLRGVLAQMFGLPKENVRVISKFVGSGFGGKLWPWTHCPLAAAAARQLGKPVKLVVSRKMMFQTVGHRPRTQQRVRLGATADGKLVSLQHDYVYTTSILDNHHEDCGETTPFQYSVPNLRVTFGRARRNIGAPADMRGPGAVPGLYATESAMNELADELKIDPVKLRVLNEPKIDEGLGVPFSSRHLLECFELGAEKFGWSKRNAHGRLDETRRLDTGLGNGRVLVDRRTIRRRGKRPAPRRWHGPRRLRHAGHRHRHVHDPRAAHRAEDRRAARQGRGRTRRYNAAGRARSRAVPWRPARWSRPCLRRRTMRSPRCSPLRRPLRDRRSRSASPTIWRLRAAGSL